VETNLSSDQEFFQETTRKFLEAECPPSELRELRDDPEGFRRAYWTQGCELGWTSLLVSEEAGGGSISGSGVIDLTLVAHEIGRHTSPGPLLASNVVAAALSSGANTDEQRDVLAGVMSGETIASWGWAGKRPLDALGACGVTATPAGDGWTLDGEARPVEAGAQAQWLLVSASSGDGATQFLVRTDAPGIAVKPMKGVDLTRRYASVAFDGVTVPGSAVVGEPDASDAVERQLELALVIQTAETAGAMDKALEITIEWAFDRYSFGRPLASYQELKHRFADMKTWLEASHAISADAARAVQRESSAAPRMVSVAASYVGDRSVALIQDCVQMHGGIGVTFDHDMHLYLRRATQNRVLYGDPGEHRRRITSLLEAAEAEPGADGSTEEAA
jgi:alkylation response protein AidB-like acyl-CoA dehydrogenase